MTIFFQAMNLSVTLIDPPTVPITIRNSSKTLINASVALRFFATKAVKRIQTYIFLLRKEYMSFEEYSAGSSKLGYASLDDSFGGTLLPSEEDHSQQQYHQHHQRHKEEIPEKHQYFDHVQSSPDAAAAALTGHQSRGSHGGHQGHQQQQLPHQDHHRRNPRLETFEDENSDANAIREIRTFQTPHAKRLPDRLQNDYDRTQFVHRSVPVEQFEDAPYPAAISGNVIDLYGGKRKDVLRVLNVALTITLGLSLFWFGKKMFCLTFSPERREFWTKQKSVAAHASFPLAVLVLIWTLKVFFPSK